MKVIYYRTNVMKVNSFYYDVFKIQKIIVASKRHPSAKQRGVNLGVNPLKLCGRSNFLTVKQESLMKLPVELSFLIFQGDHARNPRRPFLFNPSPACIKCYLIHDCFTIDPRSCDTFQPGDRQTLF